MCGVPLECAPKVSNTFGACCLPLVKSQKANQDPIPAKFSTRPLPNGHRTWGYGVQYVQLKPSGSWPGLYPESSSSRSQTFCRTTMGCLRYSSRCCVVVWGWLVFAAKSTACNWTSTLIVTASPFTGFSAGAKNKSSRYLVHCPSHP